MPNESITFENGGEERVIVRGTDKPKPRTDVVKSRRDGTERRFEVVKIDGYDKRKRRKKRGV